MHHLLAPPTAMCEQVLNLCAPKSSWRTLSELYTLLKGKYPTRVLVGTRGPSKLGGRS